MADTCAQSDLMSLRKFLSLGFLSNNLSPVSLSLAAANKSPIAIKGAFLGKLTGKAPNSKVFVSKSMVYESSTVNEFYLFHDTMLNLSILPTDFPTIGSTCGKKEAMGRPSSYQREETVKTSVKSSSPTVNAIQDSQDGCTSENSLGTCACPQRTISLSPGETSIRMQTREHLVDETVDLGSLCKLNFQHLPTPATAMHGGPPRRDSYRPRCHSQSLLHCC
jgi:hypothetical protein